MIFKTLDPANDIVAGNSTTVTTGLWSENVGTIEDQILYLNEDQLDVSGYQYFDLYNKTTSDETSEVQFSIAYGHIDGGGSPTLAENNQSTLATKAIYRQYRNLLLNPTDTKFSFQGVQSDHIYVINLNRSRIREELDPGNWELPLSGVNGIRTFIDDSNELLTAITSTGPAGRVYNIISGTISTGTTVSASSNAKTWGTNGPGYGLVYPDLGIIVLNPEAIGPAVGLRVTSSGNITGSVASASLTAPFYTSSSIKAANFALAGNVVAPVTKSNIGDNWGTQLSAYNHAALYVSLNLALSSSYGGGFQGRSSENISSTHYFVRLGNKEFNYSNNPTFVDSNNKILVTGFDRNPRVYVTTVGLYNNNNELLAVAKLSKPVRKSFDEEVLLRVRLDF